LNSQSKLLANLWARGAALQCCFNQEAIDFLIPVYHGSVAANAVFDPSCLSAIAGQVKFKEPGDQKAETLIRPFGIHRDPHSPLPYLALLMELGNESSEKSKIKTKLPEPPKQGNFLKCTGHHTKAEDPPTSHDLPKRDLGFRFRTD